MTRIYQLVALTICALYAVTLALAVVKKDLFPVRAGEVSFSIGVWGADSPWWSPRYSPGNLEQRWTFGGAHSYTTRQLMGQRL